MDGFARHSAASPGSKIRLIATEDKDCVLVTTNLSLFPIRVSCDSFGAQLLKHSVTSINQTLCEGNELTSDQSQLLNSVLDLTFDQRSEPRSSCSSCSTIQTTTPTQKTVELFLLLTQFCNLGCVYCLDGIVSYRKARHLKMEACVALRAIERFANRLNLYDKYIITLFGGEPLLNWSIVTDILKYVEHLRNERRLTVSVNVQTNLTFLPNGFIEDVAAGTVNIISNIDGREEVHNSLRPHRDLAVNSYARTVASLEKLSVMGVPYTLRATITSINARSLLDVVNHHTELGSSRSMLGLLRPVNSDGFAFDQSLIPTFDDISFGIRALLKHRPDVMYDTVVSTLRRFGSDPDLDSYCGAARMLTPTVDVRGDIYSCLWFVGQTMRRLGDIFCDELFSSEAFEVNRDALDGAKDAVCKTCEYFAMCRGGCGAARVIITDFLLGDQLNMMNRSQQCAITKTIVDSALVEAANKYILSI